MQSQPSHHFQPRRPNPAMMVVKYHSSGWRRDLEHVLKVYYKLTMQTPFRESEWAQARELFFDRLAPKKAKVLIIKEESPHTFNHTLPHLTFSYELCHQGVAQPFTVQWMLLEASLVCTNHGP